MHTFAEQGMFGDYKCFTITLIFHFGHFCWEPSQGHFKTIPACPHFSRLKISSHTRWKDKSFAIWSDDFVRSTKSYKANNLWFPFLDQKLSCQKGEVRQISFMKVCAVIYKPKPKPKIALTANPKINWHNFQILLSSIFDEVRFQMRT